MSVRRVKGSESMANYGKGDSSFNDMAVNPAGPAGLQQAAGRYSYALDQFQQGNTQDQPWLPTNAAQMAQNWYTGQNTLGIDNGWNTEFYQKFFAQDAQYRDMAAKGDDPSVYYQQFQNPQDKHTGIALWDDPNGKFKVGDVFVDGQKQEGQNVYDTYGNDTASWLLGSLYKSGSDNAQLFKRRDQAGYFEDVQAVQRDWSERAKNAPAVKAYEEQVDTNAAEIKEGAGDELITAGSVLGGAATGFGLGFTGGAVLGSWTGPGAVITGLAGGIGGSIVGGLSGLFGGLSNQDELVDIAARAYTRQQQVAAEFEGAQEIAGYGHAVEEWAKLGMKFQAPFSSVVHGAQERLNGTVGDGEMDWYGTDENGNPKAGLKWKALDLAASVADGVGQFGTPVNRALYMGTQGTLTASRVVGDAMTDKSFDEVTGQWHEYENWNQRAAVYGSIGIDAIQTAVPGLMTRAARNARQAAGIGDWKYLGARNERQAVQATDEVSLAGSRYAVDPVTGKALSRKTSLEAYVPSELARKVVVGARARQIARREETAVSPDHMYQAALELSGGSQWKTALVNGYAEGVEEFTQSYLDEWSYGRQGEFRMAMEAAAYGAAGGVGMGLGSLNQRPNREQMLDGQRKRTWESRNGKDLDDQQWSEMKKGMSKRALETLDVRTPEEDAEAARQREVTMKMMRRGMTDSPIAQAGVRVVSQAATDRELKAANELGGDALQAMGQQTNYTRDRKGNVKELQHGPNTVTMSYSQAMTSLAKKGQAVDSQIEFFRTEQQGFADQLAAALEVLNDSSATDEQKRSAEIQRDTAQRNWDQRVRNLEDLAQQQRAVRVLLGDRNGGKGMFTEKFEEFSRTRSGRKRREIINEFNTALKRLYAQQDVLSDDQGVIGSEAVKSVIELLLPRHPLQDTGSYNLMLPQVSQVMTRFNSHRVAGIHQAILKALGADHDGDNLVQQFDKYVTPEMRKNFRRGLQYMQHQGVPVTDLVDDQTGEVKPFEAPEDDPNANPGDRGRRQWEVHIDLPSSEEAYIDMLSSPLNTEDEALIVTQGLNRLKQRLVTRYVKGGKDGRGPKPLERHAIAFDELFEEFRQKVLAGVTDARLHLAQGMWDLNAEGLFAMSDVTAVPEITQMWVMVTTAWEDVQERIGMGKYAKGDPVDPEVKADRPKDKTRLLVRARLAAASIGQTMSMWGAGPEPRPSQFVHYEPLRQASIDWGLARREDTLKRADTSLELAIGELYRLLGSGETQSDLENLDSKDAVKKRVLKWVHDLATELAAQAGEPPERFYLLVASMEAGNFIGNPNEKNPQYSLGDEPISMLQLFLRRSIQIEENIHADREKDGTLDKQLKKLRTFAYPRGPRSTTSAEALVEIFGDMSPYDLLGEDAHYFGANLTLRQHQRLLLSMSQKAARREWGKYKRVGAYFRTAQKPDPIVPIYTVDQMSTLVNPTEDDDGVPHINGYTILVDAVQTATAAARRSREERAEDDAKDLAKGFRMLHSTMDTWYEMNTQEIIDLARADGSKVERKHVFRHMLARHPDLAEVIVNLVPEASMEFVFQLKDGHATAAQFMEDVLTDPNLDRAVAQFYVYTKFAEWAAMQRTPWDLSMIPVFDKTKNAWVPPESQDVLLDDILGKVHPYQIKSRFLETLYYLNTLDDGKHELNRFLQTVLNPTSLPSMFKAINDEPVWMFDRAELLPFNDSVEDYELMPSDVYATGGPDVTYREKLQEFSSAIQRHAENLVYARDMFRDNEVTIAGMLAQQEFETRPTSGMKHSAHFAQILVHLDKAIEHAQIFGDLVGPRIREQIMEAFDQMLLRMHDKGKSDERVVGIAEVRATVDTIGFGTAMVLEMNAVHSHSWEAVAQSPTMLTEGPVRIMLKDGSTFVFDLSTRQGALDALADPVTQQFAIAALLPVMRDINSYNVVQMYTDSEVMDAGSKKAKNGKGNLAFMLEEAATNVSLFNDKGSKYGQAMRLIAFVEAQRAKEALNAKTPQDVLDGYYPIMRMVNEILEAYQTTSGTGRSDYQREQLHRQLVMDIGDALKMVGQLDASLLPETKNMLFAIMQQRIGRSDYLEKLFETEQDAELRAEKQEAFKMQTANMFKADSAAALEELKKAQATGTQQEIAEAQAKWFEAEQRLLEFMDTGNFDLVTGMAARDWDSARLMFSLQNTPGSETADALKKVGIVSYLMEGGRINKFESVKESVALKNAMGEDKVSWAALFDKFLQNASGVTGGLDTINDWDLRPEEWEQLSIWATVTMLGERAGRSSSDVKALWATSKTVATFQRLHDSSWSFLLDELFNPKTHQAMSYLTAASGNTDGFYEEAGLPTTTSEIARRLSTTVLSEDRVADWNPAVPVNMLKMELALRQARSSVEIPKGGDYPKIFGPINGVTSGISYEKPPADYMTLFEFTMDPDTAPLLETLTVEDFIVLHNHFVDEVSFVLSDGTVVDLMPTTTTVDTTNDETRNSGLQLLNLTDLSRMVEQLRAKNPGAAGLRINVVDNRKQPFDSPLWVNNRFFDGRGRDAVGRSETSLIASMIFGLGAESKRQQQGPLNVLSKNGELSAPYRNSDYLNVQRLETGTFREAVMRKAWHLLSRNYPTSQLFMDDLPAMYIYVKMRHVVVGRNPDTGKKEVWWVQDYIQKEAMGQPINLVGLNNSSEPPELVALEEGVAERIYGGSGYDKYDAQRPQLNVQDLPRLPDLSEARLKRLGLDRLGETADVKQSPIGQFRPLPRSVPSAGSAKNVRSDRELDLDAAVRRADEVKRARGRDRGMDIEARRQGPMQKMYEMLRYDPASIPGLLQQLGVPGQEPLGSADILELRQSARVMASLKDTLDDRSMVWEFRMDVDTNDYVNGMIGRLGLADAGGSHPDAIVYGDVVVIDLASILKWTKNEKDATRQALQVADELSRLGARIMLGGSVPNTDLRRVVADHLTNGPSQVRYQRTNGAAGHFFEPVYDDKRIDRTRDAYDADLTALDQEAAKNINVVYRPDMAAGLNEGVREVTDRFFEVYRKVVLRLVPTSFTLSMSRNNVLAWALPRIFVERDGDKFAEIATELVNYARAEVKNEKTGKMERPGEKELLRRLGGLDENLAYRKYPNGTYKPGIRPPKDALKIFIDTLAAGNLPLGVGSQVMTGDLYLLMSQRGELMIHRVGYKLPSRLDKGNLSQQWSEPLGGIGGLKLAVGPNKPDKTLTHVPPFTVTEVDPDAKDGVMLKGEHDLDWAKKIVSHGLKMQTTAMPRGLSFAGGRLSQFNDTAIGSRVGGKDTSDKSAGRGTATKWRNVWALTGVDFTEDLIRIFVPDDGTLNPAQRKDRMLLTLRNYARMNNSLTGDEAARLLSDPLLALQQIRELNERGREELGAAWIDVLPPDLRDNDLTESFKLSDDQRLAQIFLTTLAISGMVPEQLISNPGLLTVQDPLTSNAVVGYLPSVFADAFNSLKYPELHQKMIARANAVFPTFVDENTQEVRQSAWFDHGFKLHVVMRQQEGKDKVRYYESQGYVQLETPLPADENAINLAFNVPGARDASLHLARTDSGQGIYSTVVPPRKDAQGRVIPRNLADRFYGEEDYEEFDDESVFFDFITRVAPNPDENYYPAKYMMPMEHAMWLDADEEIGWFLQPANRDEDWPDNGRALELLEKLNLPVGDLVEIDYLVRQFVGAPAPRPNTDEIDSLNHQSYVQAVQMMLDNVNSGMQPLHGGDVPMPHHGFWYKLFVAQEATGNRPPWRPLTKIGRKGERTYAEHDWGEWVVVLMDQVRTSNKEFHGMFATPLAGMFHSYQNTNPSFATQPLTMNEMHNAQLADKDSNAMFISIDPGVAALAHDPMILETMQATWKVISGHADNVFRSEVAGDVPASSVVYRANQRRKWLEQNGITRQKKATMRDFSKEGFEYKESLQARHIFLHSLAHISIVNRLLNLGLYVGAPIEVGMRNALERVTDVLVGRNVGASGRLFSWVGDQSQEGPKPRYNREQRKRMDALGKQIGGDPKWRGQLMGETTYRANLVAPVGQLDEDGNPVEVKDRWGWGAFWERMATRTATIFNDPTFGMRKSSAGKRYLQGAMEYLDATGNYVDFDVLMQALEDDSLWLMKQFPRSDLSPHKMGANAVAQVRSTRGTVLGDTIMSPVDKLFNSQGAAKVALGTLLKIPLAFTRFQANALLTLTGLGYLDSMTAAALHDRQTAGSWIQQRYRAWKNLDEAPPEYRDYSDVLETFDMERLILRGAVSQTGLAMAAMYGMQVLGLGGEDEEERKRRLRDKYLGIPPLYDPREAENGFEYADAIWLDEIPLLGQFWQRDLGGELRSPVVPHWILRQFTSPLMGVVRAFSTGDFANVRYGFLDAASVIPNSMLGLWREADATASMILNDLQALEDLGVESNEVTSRMAWMLVSLVGVYEKAMIENQMFNTWYVASDEVDRNPFAIPETTKTGEIVREQGTGYPEPTTALQQTQTDPLLDPVSGEPIVDEKGNPILPENQLQYAKRSGMDGYLHQYTETNLSAAVLLSLLPGAGFFFRNQMVDKTQKVPIALGEEDELKALAVAAFFGKGGQETFTKEEIAYAIKYQYEKANMRWSQPQIDAMAEARYKELKDRPLTIADGEVGEILTTDGAKGVFRSLHAGAITFADPALQGAYFPREMRQQVAIELLDEIVQESIDMGMSPQAAEFRKRRLWYGDQSTGQPGLREFIYSNELPSQSFTEYTQLNVTYAPGPDGKMWATPFTRANMLGALGVPLPTSMAKLQDGTSYDTRGNVVNNITKTNTGMKAVVPSLVQEQLKPDDSVLEKTKDANKTTPKWSWSGGYRRDYGGYGRSYGGGGGYSSDYKSPMFTDKILRAIRAGYGPQMDGSYAPNFDNPIIRRADVRRERVASERGRLKQWQ